MEPVNPVGLSRLNTDITRVEKPRRVRRGGKRQDEYRPSKRPQDSSAEPEADADTFERSDRPK